jgi:hypothetical protein
MLPNLSRRLERLSVKLWALHVGKLVVNVLKSPSIRTMKNNDTHLMHEEYVAVCVNTSSKDLH